MSYIDEVCLIKCNFVSGCHAVATKKEINMQHLNFTEFPNFR